MIIDYVNLGALCLFLCSFWLVLYLMGGMFCMPEGETKLAKIVIKVVISVIIIVMWVWLSGLPIS